MKLQHLILPALILAQLAACAVRKDEQTPFVHPIDTPVVDVPVDASHGTKYCKPDASGNFDPTGVVMTSGVDDSTSIAWADGGGCVLRPIREVWAALQNVQPMKWDSADSLTFVRTDHPQAGFTHLYAIDYSKATQIGPIDWTIQWFHGFDLGTFDAPIRVNIRYQKTAGTIAIPTWQGGITLSRINANVTSLGMHNQFQARQNDQTNQQSAEDAVTEVTGKARTVAPDWTNLNTGFRANPSQPD